MVWSGLLCGPICARTSCDRPDGQSVSLARLSGSRVTPILVPSHAHHGIPSRSSRAPSGPSRTKSRLSQWQCNGNRPAAVTERQTEGGPGPRRPLSPLRRSFAAAPFLCHAAPLDVRQRHCRCRTGRPPLRWFSGGPVSPTGHSTAYWSFVIVMRCWFDWDGAVCGCHHSYLHRCRPWHRLCRHPCTASIPPPGPPTPAHCHSFRNWHSCPRHLHPHPVTTAPGVSASDPGSSTVTALYESVFITPGTARVIYTPEQPPLRPPVTVIEYRLCYPLCYPLWR